MYFHVLFTYFACIFTYFLRISMYFYIFFMYFHVYFHIFSMNSILYMFRSQEAPAEASEGTRSWGDIPPQSQSLTDDLYLADVRKRSCGTAQTPDELISRLTYVSSVSMTEHISTTGGGSPATTTDLPKESPNCLRRPSQQGSASIKQAASNGTRHTALPKHMVLCRVTLLDGSEFTIEIEVGLMWNL